MTVPPDLRPAGDEPGSPTSEKLLDVAEELFASRGFRATTVRHITTKAGCNLAAVNYHFHSKRALYRAVLLRRLRTLREQRLSALAAVAPGAGGDAALVSVLEGFAEAFLVPFQERRQGRDLLRLLERELLDPQLPGEELEAELVEPVRRALREAIGRAAPWLDEPTLALCVQSFVAQLLHLSGLRRRKARAREMSTDAELVAHVVRFTAAAMVGLRPRPDHPEEAGGPP